MNKAWMPLIVLLVLAAVCALLVSFYVHYIKGVAFYGESVSSQTLLIVELLLFVLLAVLVGLALGWWLQEPRYQGRQQIITSLLQEQAKLDEERVQLLHSNSSLRTQLVHIHDQHREEKIRLQRSLEEFQRQHATQMEEISRLRSQPQPVNSSELDVLRFKNRQLTQQLEETEARIKELQVQLAHQSKETPIETPSVKRENDRDDLSLIRGIGPVLARQLNKLGIFTFNQVANFNTTQIEQINSSIRFPGRMFRERWMEQARKLMQRP